MTNHHFAENPETARRKYSYYLILGAAISLALPLLGVLYLRISESSSSPGISGLPIFILRGSDGSTRRKIAPSRVSAAPALPAPAAPPPRLTSKSSPKSSQGGYLPPAEGSLGFIRGGSEYYQEQAPATAPAQPTTEPKAKAKPASKKAKPAKKPVKTPRLKTLSGYSDFRNKGLGRHPQESQGDSELGGMLQNIPAGAGGDAELQKLLNNIPGSQQGEQR
jgi:hypothetical protein